MKKFFEDEAEVQNLNTDILHKKLHKLEKSFRLESSSKNEMAIRMGIISLTTPILLTSCEKYVLAGSCSIFSEMTPGLSVRKVQLIFKANNIRGLTKVCGSHYYH